VIAIIVDILRQVSHALAVILAAASTLAAQPYDFGHRTHLTMRLACVRCHPAAPTSTRPPAAGEATFSSDACLDCHGRAILNLQPAPQPPIAHFNHALHLGLKDQTCAACHHGLLESDKVTDAVFPRMAECATCHKEVNQPGSCPLCHAKDDPRLQSQKPAPGTSQSR
jgi:hypothetical protein